MKVRNIVWYTPDKKFRYHVAVVVTNGLEQFLFLSHFSGLLAIFTRKDADHEGKRVVYEAEYGNRNFADTPLDNRGVLMRAQNFVKKSHAGYRVEFEVREPGDMSFGDSQIEMAVRH